jgi:hypothetical protein
MTSFQSDFAATRTALETSVSLGREADDRAVVAWALGLQALVMATSGGDLARAARLAADSQITAIASGELWRQGPALSCLAHVALRDGDYQRACHFTEDALTLFRRSGDKWALEQHLCDLAFIRLLNGHYPEAEAACAEGIAVGQELADRLMTGYFMAVLAGALAARHLGVRSVRLWGAMERVFESVGSLLDPMYQDAIGRRFVEALKPSLGDDAYRTALLEGRAMSLTESVQQALAEASG